MAEAVSSRSVAAEASVRSQISPRGICHAQVALRQFVAVGVSKRRSTRSCSSIVCQCCSVTLCPPWDQQGAVFL